MNIMIPAEADAHCFHRITAKHALMSTQALIRSSLSKRSLISKVELFCMETAVL